MAEDRSIVDDLGACLTLIHATGEWQAAHDAMLDRWRDAQGEAGKTGWRWWVKPEGDELYQNDLDTRDEAISWALREYGGEFDGFELIEARCWTDEIEGDEGSTFAETRNHEVLQIAVQAVAHA